MRPSPRSAPAARALLALWLGLLASASPAAADPNEVVASETRHGGWVTYTFALGRQPVSAAALVRDAAEVSLLVEETPRGWEGRLRTARYLAPGSYSLRLDERTRPARVGSPAEAAAATQRLEAWYAGARETFRELTQTLERRGRFHLALREAERDPQLAALRNGFLLESWRPALIGARMDLATFSRRVLLPPRPAALAALERLSTALEARARAWEDCLLKEGQAAPPPGPNTPVEEAASALAQALELPPALAGWRAGSLAEPPPAATPGQTFRDGTGISLPVPAGATVLPCSDPVDRLIFKLEGATVVLRVLDYPGVSAPADLQARLRRDAFERWTSYKLLNAAPGPSELRLEFTAGLTLRQSGGARGRAHVTQWARFGPSGERTYLLIAYRAAQDELPTSVRALFDPAVFALPEEGR